jgi:outer membrane receptor protein involved in Fe transport
MNPLALRPCFVPPHLKTSLVLALSAATLSLNASAQDSATAEDEALILEEVVVTAQKRTEKLQEVPISVAVTSGEKLEDANIVNLEALTQYTPNLFVAENPIGNYIFIRGIGSQTNQGIEQSVATYADGVYRGRMQQSRAPFLDLENTQVLRGPQSILFGKNTIGGAIILNSRKPTETFEATVQGTYQLPNTRPGRPDFSGHEAIVTLSGPLGDTVGARLAIRDFQADGYMENLVTGDDDPERDEQTARVVFTWTPNDAFDAMLRYEHSDFDSTGRNSQAVTDYPFDWDREVANDGGRDLVANGTITDAQRLDKKLNLIDGEYSKNSLDEASLKLQYVDGDYRYVSITGFSGYDYEEHTDADMSPDPLIQVFATEEYSQLSEELRFEKNGGEHEYTLGYYWQTSEIDYDEADGFAANLLAADLIPASLQGILAPALVPNISRPFNFDQDADTYAAFGESRWHITEKLTLITGLRYTYETKEATQNVYYQDLGSSQGYSCAGAPSLNEALLNPDLLSLGLRCQLYTGYLTKGLETLFANDPATLEAIRGMLNLGTYEHNFEGERSEGQWTPSIKLQFFPGEDAMLYVSATSGFKGGGFDARILVDDVNRFRYKDEEALNLEIGGKFTVLNGAGEINVAIFNTEIDDLQVSSFDGYTGFVVGNAAEMRSRGVETDMRWLATDWLTVMGSVAYLDSRFRKFEDAGCTSAQFVAYAQAHPGERAKCSQDLSDARTFLSPEWTSSLAFITANELTDTLMLNGGLDINFHDNYFLDADNDPNLVQPAFTLFNARVGLSNFDDTWEVALMVKNLTDKVWAPNGADIPLEDGKYFMLTSPPRTYALQFQLKL